MTPLLSEAGIAARIERLPPSGWHVRMRVIVGAATFFDAFDVITIATVLPSLVDLWKLDSRQIGYLIAAGFLGQAIGAILFGYLAERVGRMKVAMISVLILALMSLACAAARTIDELIVLRFLQGMGLGGEVPVAAAYINEIARSHGRGRFVLLYENVFLFGVAACSVLGAIVIPLLGYRWMFIIGGVPALLVIPMRRFCPESPRWLASRGRLEEADRVLTAIEADIARTRPLPAPDLSRLPPIAPPVKMRIRELFEPPYRTRTFTVWAFWFCSYLLSYGQGTWLPTIYRTIYRVPVDTALWLGALATVVSLASGITCALLIDRVGRKRWIRAAFFATACPLLLLAILGATSVPETAILATTASACVITITIILYVYTPELYPTRLRAMGTATATFWPRLASIIGATLVGHVLPHYGVQGVFALFAGVALIGALASVLGRGPETSERMLEDLSP